MSDIHDNPAMSRYEMAEDGVIAFVAYRRDGNRMVLTHTEVPETMAGRGIGSKLVCGVLNRLDTMEVTVVPLCKFVAAYIERHPGYQEMLTDVG